MSHSRNIQSYRTYHLMNKQFYLDRLLTSTFTYKKKSEGIAMWDMGVAQPIPNYFLNKLLIKNKN